MSRERILEIKQACGGKLPRFTPFHGIPLVYVTSEDESLCVKCAHVKFKSLVGFELHYEGKPIECDHCGAMIESAYGDPEGEEQE